MNPTFGEIFNLLHNPNPAQARDALKQLEREVDEVALRRFAAQARELDLSLALELCQTLAVARSEPLVNLLGRFVCRREHVLRERALHVLEQVPPARRMQALLDLLEEDDPEIQVAACRLLAASASQAPRSALVAQLHNPDADVVLAALSALRTLDLKDATDDILPLLRHEKAAVRAGVIETLTYLASEGEYPVDELRRLLREEEALDVQLACCWSLGKRPMAEAQEELIAALESGGSEKLRVGAAAALGHYPYKPVARALLWQCAKADNPSVALSARRALNRMPEELTIDVCKTMLVAGDTVVVRREVAETLGYLTFAHSTEVLLERLDDEEDPIVRASVVEAVGHSGETGTWARVRKCVFDDELVAYAAVKALADLLDEPHLADFARLLQECEVESIREAVLKQLSLFGEAHGLPPELDEYLLPLIHHPATNVAMLAASALGFVEKPMLVTEVLDALQQPRVEPVTAALCEAAMTLANDMAIRLLVLGGVARLRSIRRVIDHTQNLGPRAEIFFRKLAEYALGGEKEAESCMLVGATLEPQAFVRSFEQAEGEQSAVLLRVWQHLGEQERGVVHPPYADLLASPSAAVRLAAIQALPPEEGHALLSTVSDMAFIDADEKVREAARVKTRWLVAI